MSCKDETKCLCMDAACTGKSPRLTYPLSLNVVCTFIFTFIKHSSARYKCHYFLNCFKSSNMLKMLNFMITQFKKNRNTKKWTTALHIL